MITIKLLALDRQLYDTIGDISVSNHIHSHDVLGVEINGPTRETYTAPEHGLQLMQPRAWQIIHLRTQGLCTVTFASAVTTLLQPFAHKFQQSTALGWKKIFHPAEAHEVQ